MTLHNDFNAADYTAESIARALEEEISFEAALKEENRQMCYRTQAEASSGGAGGGAVGGNLGNVVTQFKQKYHDLVRDRDIKGKDL